MDKKNGQGDDVLRRPFEERMPTSCEEREQAWSLPLHPCLEENVVTTTNDAKSWKLHVSCQDILENLGTLTYIVKCFGKEMSHSSYLRACHGEGYRQATLRETQTFFRLGRCLTLPRQQPIHAFGSYRSMSGNPPQMFYPGIIRRCDMAPDESEDPTWIFTDMFRFDMSKRHAATRRFLLIDPRVKRPNMSARENPVYRRIREAIATRFESERPD